MNPLPAVRLLAQCDALGWKHLPVAGGLYDQHPDFLESAMLLHQLRGEHEERKRKEDERKSKNHMGSARRGRRR